MTSLLTILLAGVGFFVILYQEGQLRRKDQIIEILQQQLVDLARRCPKP